MARTMQTASMGPLLTNGRNQVMTQIEIWMASRVESVTAAAVSPMTPSRSLTAAIKDRILRAINKAKSVFQTSTIYIKVHPSLVWFLLLHSLTCKTHIDQQVTELLKRSVPIWPMQLRRYTESFPQSLGRDYNVPTMKTDPIIGLEGRDGWEEFIHPPGATYSYNAKMVHRLKSWINVSRTKLNGQEWLLVVEPVLVGGEEIYPYYYVVPEKRIITWLEPLDGYLLFQECTAVWHWNHKRLELEAQFWKHVEYFPCGIEIRVSEVRALRIQMNWYRIVDDQRSEELAEPDGTMKEQGIAICGA
ncbi:uncharacterized protein EDB91DRAFT_1076842 [Suillus paluster]|uniref:uncharacterized protein n=1 Tax=Suillus paluster TaxID=48578 RepID=UPI001B879E91|nr:uncharacterized protein EDB91DRAFT_1076842 [Suillus paluster]KAG1754736.1 hypothetical protein EDB91DRAFT_1076842 [Suillus paluster]